MEESTPKVLSFPLEAPSSAPDAVLRRGAQKMLIEAIEAEVAEFLGARRNQVDSQGRRLVVRNGYLPEREIQTQIGDLKVRQSRVRDRRPAEQREVFTSKILPAYLRRTKSLEDLIPWLYLKGVSTGEFGGALQALVGADANGLSATTITRLKGIWQHEFEEWSKRSLKGRRYVYLWADGNYFNVRLESPESKKQCILVLIGATEGGTKELVAIQDGFKESTESWREVLLDLKQRGLESAPEVIVGDGTLGLWAAVRQEWPTSRQQRCWVHKTGNVLACLPDSVQDRAGSDQLGGTGKARAAAFPRLRGWKGKSVSEIHRAMERLGLPGLCRRAASPAGAKPARPVFPWPERGGGEVALVTLCTADHLPFARVLAESVARDHPGSTSTWCWSTRPAKIRASAAPAWCQDQLAGTG